LEAKTTELAALTTDFEKLRLDKTTLENAIDQLKTANDVKNTEHETKINELTDVAKQKAIELEALIDAHKTNIANLTDDVAALKEKLKKLQQTHDDTLARIAGLEATIADLNGKVANVNANARAQIYKYEENIAANNLRMTEYETALTLLHDTLKRSVGVPLQ
jgi:chromosome segregation ATPase